MHSPYNHSRPLASYGAHTVTSGGYAGPGGYGNFWQNAADAIKNVVQKVDWDKVKTLANNVAAGAMSEDQAKNAAEEEGGAAWVQALVQVLKNAKSKTTDKLQAEAQTEVQKAGSTTEPFRRDLAQFNANAAVAASQVRAQTEATGDRAGFLSGRVVVAGYAIPYWAIAAAGVGLVVAFKR
jgi:hypothetical protein